MCDGKCKEQVFLFLIAAEQEEAKVQELEGRQASEPLTRRAETSLLSSPYWSSILPLIVLLNGSGRSSLAFYCVLAHSTPPLCQETDSGLAADKSEFLRLGTSPSKTFRGEGRCIFYFFCFGLEPFSQFTRVGSNFSLIKIKFNIFPPPKYSKSVLLYLLMWSDSMNNTNSPKKCSLIAKKSHFLKSLNRGKKLPGGRFTRDRE